ncbi:MAG: hypothetical protein LUG91_07760 [Ruminococcus sp.]|nr:hypothetical protein [Ruminococcus sp.]
MSFLIVLGILGIYGSAKIYENSTRNTHVRTPEETEKLMLQMVGKSKRDARKILRGTYKPPENQEKPTSNTSISSHEKNEMIMREMMKCKTKRERRKVLRRYR